MNKLEKFQNTLRTAAGIIRVKTTFVGNNITYAKKCAISKEIYSVTINIFDYNRIEAGEYIQNVLPLLSADQREFIISGTTPAEWKDIFNL